VNEAQEETIPVDNLDQFVQILTAWHAEKCAVVQHLLTIPEGSEFEVGNEGEEQTKVVLTGESLAAFKLGIEMVMMQLGELPFVAEMDEDEPVAG
jgi:hypothetical protein